MQALAPVLRCPADECHEAVPPSLVVKLLGEAGNSNVEAYRTIQVCTPRLTLLHSFPSVFYTPPVIFLSKI
jgi:hypothetical protein